MTELPVMKLRSRQATIFLKTGRRYACRIGLPILMLKVWRIFLSAKQLSVFLRALPHEIN
jgi:hypothetical protein